MHKNKIFLSLGKSGVLDPGYRVQTKIHTSGSKEQKNYERKSGNVEENR